MENLKNKPESEMGVPLGGSYGRLISPFEAEELRRRDNAKKKKAAEEQATQEKRERREYRHKWIREEAAFDKQFQYNSTSAQSPSLSSQIGCAIIGIFIFLSISVLIVLLGS